MSEHKYKVAYKTIHLGDGKTKAELIADPELEGYGGTDNFIMVSTILPEDGSRSVQWTSSDGEGNSLPQKEIFDVMVLMARDLALSDELDPGREKLCWAMWNCQLQAMGLPEQDLEDIRRKFGPVIEGRPEAPVYTCPICKAESYSRVDAEHGYCGRCDKFEGPLPEKTDA